MPNRKYKEYSRAAEIEENILIGVMDARELLKAGLEKIKDIQARDDFWESPKLIKQVRTIKTAMYEVLVNNDINDALEGDEIDRAILAPILAEASAQTDKTISVEVTGKDGGAIETVRRISPADFEKFSGALELLKNDQRKRLIDGS